MMWNKSLVKLGLTFLVLSLIDILVIGYWWFRCIQVHSSFYCDSFAFGGILMAFGIPALILLGLSLIFIIISRFYRKDTNLILYVIFIVLGVIIFAAPYCLWFCLLSTGLCPDTYLEFNTQMEQV